MNWPTAALGELTKKIGSGSTPRGGEESYKISGIPLIRSMNVHDGEFVENGLAYVDEHQAAALDHVTLQTGDVLLNITGASVARVCKLPDQLSGGRVNQHVSIVRPDTTRLDAGFLAHLLRAPECKSRLLRAAGAGATREAITKAQIEDFKIPLPPLDEQWRIAAILDKAYALRRKCKRAIEVLDTLTQSMFREIFGDGRSRSDAALVELIDPDDRINYGVVQPGEDDPDGVFLIRVSDLMDGRVSHAKLRRVSREISDGHSRSLLRGNEILVSCVGSIGNVALATEHESGFNIARAVARIPISDSTIRNYVAEYLRSPVVQGYFTKELRAVSQPTLNIKQISETRVPLPPKEDMQSFTKFAVSVRQARERGVDQLSKQELLFSSLQHRAFSGQL